MKKITIAQLALLSARRLRSDASYRAFCIDRRRKMVRLVAVVFALALTSSAQAKSVAPKREQMVTTVRTACGAGFHRVNAVCVRNTTARAIHHPTVGAGYRH